MQNAAVGVKMQNAARPSLKRTRTNRCGEQGERTYPCPKNRGYVCSRTPTNKCSLMFVLVRLERSLRFIELSGPFSEQVPNVR
jgi:hypothetical protein